MNQNLILLPVIVQVLLTLVVMVLMAGRRRTALVSGSVRIKDIALGQNAWPEDTTKASNNYKSQFEVPVLFYLAAVVALITRSVDIWLLALAWVFVAARVAHSVVHIGSNYVPHRFYVFLVGVAAVLAMWVMILLRAVAPIL